MSELNGADRELAESVFVVLQIKKAVKAERTALLTKLRDEVEAIEETKLETRREWDEITVLVSKTPAGIKSEFLAILEKSR